jgi:hypothetical protein
MRCWVRLSSSTRSNFSGNIKIFCPYHRYIWQFHFEQFWHLIQQHLEKQTPRSQHSSDAVAEHATPITHHTFCARWQQGLDKLRLPNFILVKETLETVENGATEHKRLLLVHHWHQKDHNGRPATHFTDSESACWTGRANRLNQSQHSRIQHLQA